MPSSKSRKQRRPRPKPDHHVSNTDREDASNTQDSQFPQSACYHVDGFRFRELPQSVREEIYKHALEPKAEFRVGCRNEMPSSFRLLTMEFWAREWLFAPPMYLGT